MSLENPQEHLRCMYYDGEEFPVIQMLEFNCDESKNYSFCNGMLLFLMHGNASFDLGNERGKKASDGDFLLAPAGGKILVNEGSSCTVMAVRLLKKVSFCECYMVEQLFFEREIEPCKSVVEPSDAASESSILVPLDAGILKFNEPIRKFLESVESAINDGLKCRNYFEVKIKELFYLLRAYYSKDQLYNLFYAVVSPDTQFSDYVFTNYRKHKTVAQLAASMNLSHSGFARKFQKVFRQPPYKWMMEQKCEAIFVELAQGSKNLKQISSEFGFLSQTQFNDFCKEKWGKPPGAIRKKPTAE